MKTINIFLLTGSILFSNKFFSQENMGEIIPCEEIIIKCSQRHPAENVIRNNIEYQKLLNDRSQHPNCGSYMLPEIDFNQFTLLGISSGSGGCKEPIMTYSVIKLLNGNYKFIVNIKQRGYCKRGWPIEIWCLIPKIDENINVEFKKEIKIEE